MYENTQAIDTDPYLLPKFIAGFQHHLNFGPGVFFLNKKIRSKISNNNFDVVLVDNKTFLSVHTLRFIKRKNKKTIIANLLTDDPFGKFTRSWPRLKHTAALFDIFFVQRKMNVQELMDRGALRVEMCYRSFDPAYNKPLLLNEEDKKKYHAPIGFVGTYEKDRSDSIAFLIQNGLKVQVTGNDWPGGENWEIIKPFYKGPSVYGDEYIKVIAGMEIALHFLRHGNRDEQDSRTFELPASKVFMLAERSAVHLQLFEEGEEAVFFSDNKELLQKINRYTNDAQERKRIAENGYQRCFTSGYDHHSRLRVVMEQIFSINA